MMFVDLPTDVTQFIQDSVGSGVFQSESEVVTAALRIMQDRDRRITELKREIQPALDRLARGEGIELDEDSLPEFFDNLMARSDERLRKDEA